MSAAQRWWLVAWLCAIAAGLPLYFLQYRWGYADDPRLVLGTGEVHSLTDEQLSAALRYHSKIEEGIYAKSNYTSEQAASGGILLPVLLLVAAGYLVLGGLTERGKAQSPAPAATKPGDQQITDSLELRPRSRWPLWVAVLLMPGLALIDYGLTVSKLTSPGFTLRPVKGSQRVKASAAPRDD